MVCAGIVVTWDSTVDVLGPETMRLVLKNNNRVMKCREYKKLVETGD